MAGDPHIPPLRTYRFGAFELDVHAAELRKHGVLIPLTGQPYRILLMLLEHPGEVVLRDEIRAALWPGDTDVEFDRSFAAAIQTLRDALGDASESQRYVESLGRRGYRFAGIVEHSDPAAAPAGEAELDPAQLSGISFPHFRVIEKLGSGGMGVVYRADDLRLGRQVALKFLPLRASEASRQMRTRFQREARAASALNHPHICTIHGVEELAGQPAIVMELLEGETLAARLARGPLPLDKALPLAIQIAGALAEAHQKRIVHRDLKPANIMLTKSGVKVLDFGLAKIERAVAVGEDAPTLTTQVGAVLGTYHYMSPEQVQGKETDARSDIFSFGSVLFEMLTGKRAFTGGSAADLMSAILTKDPLEQLPAGALPPPIERTLRHCLEKDADERFQSARDLAFDLEAPSSLPSPERAAAPRSRKLPIAVAAILAAALAGAWWAGRISHPTAPAKFQRLTFRRGFIQSARFVPGGESVIYSAAWDGKPLEMFSTQPGSTETRALELPSTGLLATGANGLMAVAANCRYLHTKSSGTLAVLPIGGGAPREMLEDVLSADWTADGKRMAISVGGRGVRANRLEFPMGKVILEASGTGWAGDVRISPGGEAIAFLDHFYPGDDGSVAVIDFQGRKKTLTGNFTSVQGLAWSPGGKEIWFTGATDGGLERRLYAVTLAGQVRTVAQVPGGLKLMDIAPGGRVLLAREELRSSVQFAGAGQAAPRDLSWLSLASGPQVSPDGKALMMNENGEGTGGKIVTFVRGTDGSPAVRLGDWTGISLSPDGKWVAATGDFTDPRNQQKWRDSLTLVPVKAGSPRPMHNGLSLAGGIPIILWLPDSRQMLYAAAEAGHKPRTYLQDIDGGPPRPVTPEGLSAELLSPDGATMLVRDAGTNAALYPVAGGIAQPLPFLKPDYVALNFSSDARALYLVRRGERSPKIRRANLATGVIEDWREVPVGDPAGITVISSIRITPDGQSLAYAVVRVLSALYVAEGLK